MKLRIILIGKTEAGALAQITDEYLTRARHMMPVQLEVIELPRSKVPTDAALLSQAEGKLLIDHLKGVERVILLDEGGKEHTSVGFAQMLQKAMNAGLRELCLVVGGPYGHGAEVRAAYPETMALSKMTFTHQMVRPILMEQVYRALTIIHHQKYHH